MNWYKGNIHTHTTNSDGDSSPDHVASWYKKNQYDFLVLSDHNHLTILDEAETEKNKWPLLVPGEEITIREINGHPAALHINGIGIKNLITPGSYESNIDGINDVVDKVNLQGGLASINHPNYQWWVSADDIKHSKDAWAFEVFNGHMHSNNEGSLHSMSTEEIWDEILSSGKLIYGVASDDAHHFTEEFSSIRSNPGRGWIFVKSSSLKVEEIIQSMKKGEFYSSTGVELKELEISKSKIYLKIKERPPKEKQKYTIKVIHDSGVVFFEKEGDELELDTKGMKNYCRVVVRSSEGTNAWIQPFFL
tara:strand:- start:67474 stop:68391 length:918 start_codon:yes stop_codon:yes gene_type:complete